MLSCSLTLYMWGCKLQLQGSLYKQSVAPLKGLGHQAASDMIFQTPGHGQIASVRV